jgi:hypothetical protein
VREAEDDQRAEGGEAEERSVPGDGHALAVVPDARRAAERREVLPRDERRDALRAQKVCLLVCQQEESSLCARAHGSRSCAAPAWWRMGLFQEVQ